MDFVRLITGIAIRGGFGEHLLRTRAGGQRTALLQLQKLRGPHFGRAPLPPDGTRRWTRHFAGYPRQLKPQGRVGRPPVPPPCPAPLRTHRLASFGTPPCAATVPDAAASWGCRASGSAEEIQVYGEGLPPCGPSPLAAHRP